MTIGYTNPGYPVQRTILNCCDGVDYRRSRSFESVLARVRGKLGLPNRGILKTGCTYFGGTADNKVDLFHFFNLIGCGLSKKPFVTTFETRLPRGLEAGDYWYGKAVEALASDRCRRLLALSDCTRKIQSRAFEQMGNRGLDDKVVVVHPPQKILVTESEICRKLESRRGVRFVFVGSAFWHKGGGEVVRALCRIRKSYPVELLLVGDIDFLDYASDAGVDSPSEVRRLVAENIDWITWRRRVPNNELLDLIKKCDVGLLPTRADTYGYSVLEFQAAGVPCITTDVRALPEINTEDCGWLLHVEKDEFGNASIESPEKVRALSETIETELRDVVASVLKDDSIIERKSMAAYQRVLMQHSPEKYGEALMSIYKDAIG